MLSTKPKKGKLLFVFFMLAPAMGYLLMWRLFPLFYTVGLSFTSYNLLRDVAPRFTGLSNYIKLASDTVFAHSLKLSFITIGSVTLIETLLGLGIAILFDRQIRGERIFLGAIIAPMVIAPVVIGVIWYILFHSIIGPINYLLSFINIQGPEWLNSTSTALLSVIIADVWQWTPFTFLLLFSAVRTVPPVLYEAAKIDGASKIQLFRYVTLPIIKGIIVIVVLLRSMDAFKIFAKVYAMTGGGPGNATDVAVVRIYKTAFMQYRMGYAAAMVIILLLIISGMYLTYWKSA